MEKLKLDLVQLKKALKTLEDSLNLQQEVSAMDNKKILLAAEDSIIQRFEYSYESFWKFLRKYLELIHHLKDIDSSKKVFRACVKVGLCTLKEGNIFVNMANGRNETSHTYSIETSRVILSVVPQYYSAMIAVVKQFEVEYLD